MIYKTSEWVAPGHPDKVADFISEYILDRLLEKDENTRYALEVQIKNDEVNLAGEVTTRAIVADVDYAHWVEEAVNKIGYTWEYQKRFGTENTICGDDVVTHCGISQQSPDIAEGVNKDAWGDQGIFFGYFSRETLSGHGLDYATARDLGKELYYAARVSPFLGIDIKTQVTVAYDMAMVESKVTKIIVAIPMVSGKEEEGKKQVMQIVKKYAKKDTKIIINGTGTYCKHGPIADSGTTGRKLVVDFYGGRSRIGGGCPWTKDGTKADLTLNLFAHELARQAFHDLEDIQPHHVEVELSCCIGKKSVLMQLTAYDGEGNAIYRRSEDNSVAPSALIKRYTLNKPVYTYMCLEGLFALIDKDIYEGRKQ